MSSLRIGMWVALAWLGAQGCMLAKDSGCTTNSDCESAQVCNEGECVGSAASGGGAGAQGGTGQPQAVPACTTETEVERLKKFSGGVPVPPECETDLLDGDYTGHISPAATAYKGKGREEIVARIEGLTLVSLDGVPCQPASPGEINSSKAFGSEEYECEQSYACGCCAVEFKRSPLGLPGQEAMRDVWSVKKTGTECHIGVMNTEYFFNIDFTSIAPDPPDPPSGNACSECLSSCSGLPSCCTGSGCACQADCRPTSCAQGLTYCCGPYGDCICTDSCPY